MLVSCLHSIATDRPLSGADRVDWEVVLEVARAVGMGAALGFAAKAGRLGAAPPSVRQRALDDLATATARHVFWSAALARVLGACAGRAIPIVVLKGALLAETLYAHPGLRPFHDLDLLIRPPDVLRADALLRGLGYRRLADEHSWDFDLAYDGSTVYEEPGGARVDLHWRLLTDPRYRWSPGADAEVWDRLVTVEVAGQPALALAPADSLIYLALHLAVHHGLRGLLWRWDLTLLLGRASPALDWDVVVARARRWRVRAALYFALEAVRVSVGVEPPERVMARLRPRGLRARLLARLVSRAGRDASRDFEHLTALLLIDRGRDCLAALLASLFPAPAWVRARYGCATTAGGYAAHYRRLGAIVGRTRKGLAPGVRRR